MKLNKFGLMTIGHNNKLAAAKLIFIDDVKIYIVHQTPHQAFDLTAIKLSVNPPLL